MKKWIVLVALLLLPACKTGSSLLAEEKIEFGLSKPSSNLPISNNADRSSEEASIPISSLENEPRLVITRKLLNESNSDTGNPPSIDMPPISIIPVPIVIDGKQYIGYSIDTDGGGVTGNSLSNNEISSSLLKTPMIIGAIVFIGGVAAIVWLPIKKYGAMVAAAGLGLMAFSYLLTAYSSYLLIGGGIAALLAIAYLIYQFKIREDASKQFIIDLQHLKKPVTKFNHNKRIQNFVNKTKQKLKIDNII